MDAKDRIVDELYLRAKHGKLSTFINTPKDEIVQKLFRRFRGLIATQKLVWSLGVKQRYIRLKLRLLISKLVLESKFVL